ncbi:hypothetical protein FHG87_015354 [Trinorchestia longiramus]|nr:hypothetical protein FHG87_015354 [Trinorchestia longiramus]
MEVQRKCRGELKEEHDIKDLETRKVLSCALKMKRPHNGKGNPTFSFSHKTDQECIAVKFVVHKIEHSNICVQEILFGEESPTYRAFLEVLQYVVQDLSTKSPKLFVKRWPELKEALQEVPVSVVHRHNSSGSQRGRAVLCCCVTVSAHGVPADAAVTQRPAGAV